MMSLLDDIHLNFGQNSNLPHWQPSNNVAGVEATSHKVTFANNGSPYKTSIYQYF
jgi:hypothetical protein